MNKKITIIPIVSFLIIIGIVLLQDTSETESEIITTQNNLDADIVMPNKSSRPGCDQNNLCYIPSEIVVMSGESVIWQNQDVAFHSVTSGFYGNSTGLFDSGHLDPDETFTITFTENGEYDYFCTLHPWMKGKVIVKN